MDITFISETASQAFLNTYNSLEKYREERNLSIENQKEGLFRNLCEELGELAEGIKNNDKEAQLDAYCDMFVFCMNTIHDVIYLSYSEDYIRGEYAMFNSLYNDKERLLKLIYNLFQCKDATLFYYELCLFLTVQVYKLGYNFELAMKETIKEVSSRKGKWNNELKKFVKDPNQDPATLYKANYEGCKLSNN